ncbi:GH16787 [Drosophila grimshawi]|uniref:GH16787 n=1 Tax=Drosophila grimshawi TaxID=7222 RepID=B4J3T2_DROGR|nr:GH16787 [Drosophila grimshawi]
MDISESELRVLRDAFDLLDRDKEGTVQARDLGAFLRKINKTHNESELQALINQVDTDGNGIIDFQEFAGMILYILNNNQVEDDIREAFRVYDRDNTGYIGVDQLRDVLIAFNMKPSNEELEELIREADDDEDGFLNYEEFSRMMSPTRK